MKSEARYGVALALLLLVYVLQGFRGSFVEPIVDLLLVLLFLVILIDPRWPRVGIWAGLLAVAISVGLTVAFTSTENSTLGALSFTLNAVLLFWAVVLVVIRVARQQMVTLTTVLGALLAYALLGFAFASVYAALGVASAGDALSPEITSQADYVYFSFVTLTTLGFGDITPVADIVKRLVVIEALVGQVFLVVLVARLVALWARPSKERDEEVTSASD